MPFLRRASGALCAEWTGRKRVDLQKRVPERNKSRRARAGGSRRGIDRDSTKRGEPQSRPPLKRSSLCRRCSGAAKTPLAAVRGSARLITRLLSRRGPSPVDPAGSSSVDPAGLPTVDPAGARQRRGVAPIARKRVTRASQTPRISTLRASRSRTRRARDAA